MKDFIPPGWTAPAWANTRHGLESDSPETRRSTLRHSWRPSHTKAVTTFRPGGVWQLLFTFYAEFIRWPTHLQDDEDVWNKAKQIRDPDDVTAEAQMWDKDYWNDLHNPHYHTACPTAVSWHNSDLWTLLRVFPIIPRTPNTKFCPLLKLLSCHNLSKTFPE